MQTFAIKADRFILPGSVAQGGYLTICDGKFGSWSAEEPACEVRDYTGCIVAPGQERMTTFSSYSGILFICAFRRTMIQSAPLSKVLSLPAPRASVWAMDAS